MTFTVRASIATPPETAFDRMADARNETSWNSQVSRAELLTGEPIRAGSRFTTVNRGKAYVATISRYDRPGELVFDVTGDPLDIVATFAFAAVGEGTQLAAEFDMKPKRAMKLLLPVLKPIIRRDLTRQAQSFKAFCESSE